jgi:DNA-binding beta-propeller fold protein YncE
VSRRLSLFVLLVLLGSCLTAASAPAARLYVPGYGTGPPEEIGGFDLGADGTLTPIPGSPFPGATAGSSDGLRRLAFTPDGARAATGFFVGDGGVQGYSVPASGIFGMAAETPTGASVTSLAITPDGRFAYAATREFGGHPAEGVHRFAVAADGSLISLGPPTPLGSSSYGVAVSPDGRFLFAAEGNAVARFAVGADGSLAPLGTTPVPGAQMLATSADERFLYVFVEAGGEPGIAVFEIGADGGLEQRGTPAQLGPGSSGRGFAVAPDGRHAFLVDYNADLIATVAIAADGAPTLVPGGLPVSSPESVAVSPDGRYLVDYHEDGVEFVLGVSAIGADGSLTGLPARQPFGGGEALPMTFQPVPTPAARFTARAGVPGGATHFDASGSTNAIRYDWDFGDGTTLANGGPNPSHAYAQAGAYDVTLSVFDRNGCAARHYYDGQSTVCPGGSTTTASDRVDTLPVLGKPKAVPRKFAPRVKGAKKGKVKLGTVFRYTVNEPAKVRFTIERKLKRKGRRARFKRVGFLTQKAKAGVNRRKWNGKLKGKPLPAGSYRATVVATDAAGGRSPAKKVGFRILPLP